MLSKVCSNEKLVHSTLRTGTTDEQLKSLNEFMENSLVYKNKLEMINKQILLGQSGTLIREQIFEEQSSCGGLCRKMGLRPYYDIPRINLIKNQGKELNKFGRVIYDKPVMIIYNPVSGIARNTRQTIFDTLSAAGIEYEIHETLGPLDAMKFIMNFEIERYSALILVGGDGTFHESVNGLLKRSDKKQIPIGLLPNGSGDDYCAQFGMENSDVETGLRYVRKGDTVKVDVIRCLIDFDSEEQLLQEAQNNPDQIKVDDYLRYSIINSSLCLTANCARNAIRLKPYLGKHAYTIQTVIELIKRRQEQFDIEVDRESLQQNPIDLEKLEKNEYTPSTEDPEKMVRIRNDCSSQVMMVYNGSCGGGRIMLNPLAVVNDGKFELVFSETNLDLKTIMNFFKGTKEGGTQIYDNINRVYRIKKLHLINKSRVPQSDLIQSQDVNIDGEDFIFKKQMKYECLEGKLEVILDLAYLFEKYFNNGGIICKL